MTRTRVLGMWLFILVLSGVCPHAASAQQRPYVFAVIPASPPIATYALWTPFIERISRATGAEFQLKVYERMSEFERDISAGTPDFIFANPFQAVVAHQTHHYRPLVRSATPVAVGVYVLKESPIRTVNDLSSKKVAFVGNKNL